MDLGKKLLEAAKGGRDDEVRILMTNGAPFTTDWVSRCVDQATCGLIFTSGKYWVTAFCLSNLRDNRQSL